jgi:metallo-beta-lactamase class B
MNFLRSASLLLIAASALAANPPSWTEPVAPFKVAGNIHYVGTAELASFLITTPSGHILLDAPLDENVPHILRSIETLGFAPSDIRILINSHAHFDHLGGMKHIKELTGAELALSAPDAELAARGGTADFAFGDEYGYPPVSADRILADGDVVSLGGTSLTAILTPGHTRGGTTWLTEVVEDGRKLRVIVANSMTAPGYDLVGNDAYPEMVDDFRSSFDRLAGLEADVFLGPHASFFGLGRKLAATGEGNPFVDPSELAAFVQRSRAFFERQLASQTASAEVERTLNGFHEAAARADGEAYFALMTRDAVYIGTDATERWSLAEFRAFAEPYFEKGRGWTYVPTKREIVIGPDGSTAWFHELLENASYGTTRGTGVLVRDGDEWKIAQYHLTIPVPNELAKQVVEMIRARQGEVSP